MLNNDIIDFLKFHIPLFVVLGIIAVVWTQFYVIPANDWYNTIMSCQLDINDLSRDGYEYCVALHNQ